MLCRQVFTGASQQVFTGAGQQVFKSHLNAGQYVVRFGSVRHWQQQQRDKREQQEREGREGEEEKAQQYHQPWFSTEADEGPVLLVARPLSLLERAVCLALAVSLDNDYFSRHRSVVSMVSAPHATGPLLSVARPLSMLDWSEQCA
ncbi:unnamed protein product, partial [Closterium sp. NIES-54]